ncbi:MAG TPA: hypothetical protein VMV14_00665 [Acidimicrobiales bacterium]|nr:hypothetical protein [Acidimicrobiales bacterium]
MDIEEFYAQDERRRRSAEVELGTDWHDSDGARYELSWVVDTGDLYVMREPSVPMTEDPFGDLYPSKVPLGELTVAVIGWVPDQRRMEEVLAGWEEAMAAADSVSWLAERLRDHGVSRTPA